MRTSTKMGIIAAVVFVAAYLVEDLFRHTELIYIANAWAIGAFITRSIEE